jgi:hypothetical protein
MHNLDVRVSGTAPFPLGGTPYTETQQQAELEFGPKALSQSRIDFGVVRGLIVAAGLAVPFWVGVALLIRRLH